MPFDITKYFRELAVLDFGSVALIDAMVSDPQLKIVNAARVSFGKQSSELSEKDEKLIGYLYEHGHLSTYRHSYFSFRVKAPLFVLRQWWKYQTGSNWLEIIDIPDTSWNEISGRYVELPEEFYVPAEMRGQSTSNRQASSGVPENADALQDCFRSACENAFREYRFLLHSGVAREIARMVLPQNVYSEVVWTCSTQTVLHFLQQRLEQGAQFEIRQYAEAVKALLGDLLPGSGS